MQKLTIIRQLFQILALGIFLFQLQNSCQKYLDSPVVEERSLSTRNRTQQPSIYVCQENQFNHTEAKLNGYSGRISLTIGKLQDSNRTTWKGKFGNMTYEEVQNIVLDIDYSSFVSVYSETKRVYIVPHGFCMKLTENNPEQYITTQKSTMMLLVDPNKESNLRVLEMISGRLYSGPTYNKFFEQSSYELGYTIHDSKIYDGKSCTDYKRMNSSYGNCVDSIMKRHLLECYGCLPPWFPAQKGMIC